MDIELAPKRLELLKHMVPMLRTVAMLWNASDLGMTLRYKSAADAARTIGARVQPLAVREPDELRRRAGVDGLTVWGGDMSAPILAGLGFEKVGWRRFYLDSTTAR